MRYRVVAVLCIGAVMISVAAGAAESRRDLGLDRRAQSGLPRWVPGEVVVQFTPEARAPSVRRLLRKQRARVADRLGPRVKLLELAPGASVRESIVQLERDPAVEIVEPNFYRYTLVDPGPEQWSLDNTGQTHPVADGPDAAGTAGADIDANEAWDPPDADVGDPSTVIAVIDSGVDVEHPDLDGNIWVNPGEIPDNGVDDDGNGYIDDINGWDTADNDNTLLQQQPVADDDHLHGTMVSGVIAGEDDSSGIVGVCPECSIMVLKFMESFDHDDDPSTQDVMSGTLSAEVEALTYAHRNGASVVNASFGAGGLWSAIEREAVRKATGQRTFPGPVTRPAMLVIAAAGNSPVDNDLMLDDPFSPDAFPESPLFPASYALGNVISVAASNHQDRYGYFTDCAMTTPIWPCGFSAWGHESVDLAAPGVDIYTTVPHLGPADDYATVNGTSFSAPHVSGVAGLVWSKFPGRTAGNVRDSILNSVAHPATLNKVYSSVFRGSRTGMFTRTNNGRLDADGALATSDFTDPPVASDSNIRDGLPGVTNPKKGTLSWPTDTNDVYRRDLVKGRTYRARLTVPAGKNFDLWIWRPGTTEIWQLEDGCYGIGGPCKLERFSNLGKGRDEILRFTAKKTGEYYFHVPSYFSSGSYRLEVKRI